MIDMKQARILAAVGALVFSVPVQGADPAPVQMSQQNQEQRLEAYCRRLSFDFSSHSEARWEATLKEAKEGGFLDALLTHRYAGDGGYSNVLILALKNNVNLFTPMWNYFGTTDKQTIGAMLSYEAMGGNAIIYAIRQGYSDDQILNFLSASHYAGVLDAVLLLYQNTEITTGTVLKNAIKEYRSKELIEGIINLAKEVDGLVPQLVDDRLVREARDVQSPAADYLKGVKQDIDNGIIH